MAYQEFFYPLCASAPLMDGGVSVPQRVIPAGSITVPNGRLVVIDPVTGEDTSPAVAVPPGTYPVVATVARAPYPGKKPQELLSYLSVLISDEPTECVVKLPRGCAVEEFVVAIADEELWLSHGHRVLGEAAVPPGERQWGWALPLGEGTGVAARCGWEIGYVVVLLGKGRSGQITAVHLDVELVGSYRYELD